MRTLRAVWTVLQREVYAFFVSPMAYFVLTVWLVWRGMEFFMLSAYFAEQPIGGGGMESPLTSFFGQTTLFFIPLLVFVPLITMRLLAEERSRGTIEVLMTAPVSEVAIVLGKYLSALVVWGAMWLPTLLYVWLTSRYGDVDAGTTLASYLGVLGIGLYYMAIGLFMSSLARNQIVAALLTFLALGGLFVVGLGQYVFGDEYRDVFAYLSVWGHMEAFSRGVVDSRFVTFDVSVAALFLVLTVLVLRGPVAARDLTALLSKPDSEAKARGLGALNVALVILLALQLNYLGYRHYERWDWTDDSVYTLSARTELVLEQLDHDVTLWVLLGEGEPGFAELRNLIARYEAESERVEVRYVDPDRDPGSYREVAQRFSLGAAIVGERQASDVAAVVESGERHWEITRDDLLRTELGSIEENEVTLNVEGERAITGALVELSTGEPTKVCVVQGHGELAVEGGARSLGAFAGEMRRENLTLEPFETRGADAIDESCDAVALIGPTVPLTEGESEMLLRYVRGGGNLLAAIDPVPNADQTALIPMGVDGALRQLGIQLDRTLVVEPNEAMLPAGVGHPLGPYAVVGWGEHPITQGFASMDLPVVAIYVRSVRPVEGGAGVALLSTSDDSFAISDLRAIARGPDAVDHEVEGPVSIAVAIETRGEEDGGRVVVVGASSPFHSELMQEPTVVNRSLASAIMGWLTQRDALVAIEARTVARQPVSMSQEDVSNLFLRVVVLIPLAFIFLGFAVWWNRRA